MRRLHTRFIVCVVHCGLGVGCTTSATHPVSTNESAPALTALTFETPVIGLDASFSRDGAWLRTAGREVQLRTVSVSRDRIGQSLSLDSPSLLGNTVNYNHPGVREWFEAAHRGIEHGYDVAEAPAGSGPLVVTLAWAGLVPRVIEDGNRVALVSSDRGVVLWYDQLKVFDAQQHVIPSRFAPGSDLQQIRIEVDDAHALYPIRIDPLVWSYPDWLTDSAGSNSSEFGFSVAAHGDHLAVGAPGENNGKGRALLFVRNSKTGRWEKEVSLDAPLSSSLRFGHSVALGPSFAAVGAPSSGGHGEGEVHVIRKDPLNVWQFGEVLRPAGPTWFSAFGSSVNVSREGLIVGAPGGDVTDGAVFAFEDNGAGSLVEKAKLVALDSSRQGQFGASLASEGSTLMIGAPTADARRGAVYVFERDPLSGSWSQRQRLTPIGGSADQQFGNAIAMLKDRAVIGARNHREATPLVGAAYVFERNTTTGLWSQAANVPHADDKYAVDEFGASVGLTEDLVLVGAPGMNIEQGTVYAFEKDSQTGAWTWAYEIYASMLDADRVGSSLALTDGVLVSGALGSKSAWAYALRSSSGTPCGVDSECEYLMCRQGICCSTECKSPCESCAIDAELGNCVKRPKGMDPGDDCPGYVCDGKTRECPGSCIHSGDCAEGFKCNASGRCQQLDGLGSACTENDSCESGYCVDGVCCSSACAGACDSCALPDSRGLCHAVAVGQGGDPACTPYACDGSSVTCPTTCGSDAHCGAGYSCRQGGCVSLLDDGSACSSGVSCRSGFCVEGVCCESACAEACDQCNAPERLGQCVVRAQGTSGTPSCDPFVCNGLDPICPSSCTSHADCIESRACFDGTCGSKRSNGDVCSLDGDCLSGACSDGFCCNQRCDGSCASCGQEGREGTCSPSAGGSVGEPPCLPFACDGASLACPTECESSAECAEGFLCLDKTCARELEAGQACSVGQECGTGFCTDGVCCSRESCGAYRCRAEGSCAEDCASSSECASDYLCTSAGRCELASPSAELPVSCSVPSAQPKPAVRGFWLGLLALAVMFIRRRYVA